MNLPSTIEEVVQCLCLLECGTPMGNPQQGWRIRKASEKFGYLFPFLSSEIKTQAQEKKNCRHSKNTLKKFTLLRVHKLLVNKTERRNKTIFSSPLFWVKELAKPAAINSRPGTWQNRTLWVLFSPRIVQARRSVVHVTSRCRRDLKS